LRRGLTLIELLVTIIIMVTVLAAVLPAISPNNDARKIREAARQLSSLFAQAQAQAARDGRAVGVGFTEGWNDLDNDGVIDPGETTGMALEAFIVAEPPPFTGFSESSSVRIMPAAGATSPAGQNQPPNVNIVFGHGVGGEGIDITDPSDVLPPQMFRPGDTIEIGQESFEFIEPDLDDLDDDDSEPDVEVINNEKYLKSQKAVAARWVNWNRRPVEISPRGGRAYRIRRRPMTNLQPSRTAADAVQFPRGVGIDCDPTEGDLGLTIMFSPNGAIDSIYQDGRKLDEPEPMFILLGRGENSNPRTEIAPGEIDIDYTRYDFRGTVSDEALAQRREEVNLLNEDSMWVAVSLAGRVATSANRVFDPRNDFFVNGNEDDTGSEPQDQRRRQRGAAQQYAQEFQNEGGR
jgi:prepilin-type N-terminal cleavage/methylation domain-containing protein